MSVATFRTANYCGPYLLIAVVVLLSGGVESAPAQQSRSGITAPAVTEGILANYRFAETSELTISVSIIGQVQRPGLYEISKKIDLLSLLALAGGPSDAGTLGDVTVARSVQDGAAQRKVLSLDLTDLSRVAPGDLTLQSGDIISIPRSTWASVRDVFSVVVSAAIITTAISQVIIATK